MSHNIKRHLNDYNLTTVFRNTSKLDKYIKLGKDPLEKLENSNVIYKIPCLDCSKPYVGQIGRMLFVRSEEYEKNINLNEKYHNVVTKHIKNNKSNTGSQDDFDWASIKISHRESNYLKKVIAEMFFMKKEGKNILG